MHLANNTDDDAIESLAEAVFGKKLGLAYNGPINACAFPGCGMPCSGVFCLDHATA